MIPVNQQIKPITIITARPLSSLFKSFNLAPPSPSQISQSKRFFFEAIKIPAGLLRSGPFTGLSLFIHHLADPSMWPRLRLLPADLILSAWVKETVMFLHNLSSEKGQITTLPCMKGDGSLPPSPQKSTIDHHTSSHHTQEVIRLGDSEWPQT